MILNKETYVDEAEKIIKKQENKYGKTNLSTSKIRNILEMTSDIYNELSRETSEILPDGIKEKLQYLRIKIVYDSGRDKAVEKFVNDSKILDIVKEAYTSESKSYVLLFCNYMEALVAYFKYTFENN